MIVPQRFPIRCLSNADGAGARLCDFELREDGEFLVFKDKKKVNQIPLEDFEYQIEKIKERNRRK